MSRQLDVTVCFRVEVPSNIGDQNVEDIYLQIATDAVRVSCNQMAVADAEVISYYTESVEEVGLS